MATFCLGAECPIKYTCLRFTSFKGRLVKDGDGGKVIRKCTNQSRYLQDPYNVNVDGKEHRL